MNDNLYRQILYESPIGYAHHKIICDETGNPTDYVFLEVNPAFETLTGLIAADIIGKKVTDVLPGIEHSDFNWIKYYGEVALGAGRRQFEHYSKELGHWYKVDVFSPEKHFFVTQFHDITDEHEKVADLQQLMVFSEHLLKATTTDELDYQQITDHFRLLTKSKYAIFNQNAPSDQCVFSKCISGETQDIAKEIELFGFDICNSEWFLEQQTTLESEVGDIQKFSSLHDLMPSYPNTDLIAKISRIFAIGETVIVRIRQNNKVLGHFTLLFETGKHFEREHAAEIFVGFLGLSILRKRAELKLSREKIFTQTIFESIPGCIYVYDKSGKLIKWNKQHEEMTGYSSEELAEMTLDQWYDEDDYAKVSREVEHVFSKGYGETEVGLIKKNGDKLNLIVNGVPMSLGGNSYLVGIGIDVSERRKKELELEQNRELLQSVINNTTDLIFVKDTSGRYILVNAAAARNVGKTPPEVIGKNDLSNFSHDEALAVMSADKEIMKNGKVITYEELLGNSYGEKRYLLCTKGPVYDQNHNVKGVFGILRDITDRKQKQNEIEYLSYHDSLTGLYNRRYFENILVEFNKENYVPVSIIMADINGLKLINDSFGHTAGDSLLKKSSDIFLSECPKNAVACRLGGDEFVIMLPNTDNAEAELLIQRIRMEAAKEKIGPIEISISFGCQTKQNQDQDINKVLANAENDMYQHKLYESLSTRSQTIDVIMNALFEKSKRESSHSKRVSALCATIATEMQLGKDTVNQIKMAGLIHDIGKIGISETILNKPGPLNENEWEEMKKHPEASWRILNSVKEFTELADFVLEHHEKWDGSGYPRGLQGEKISLQARIIALADAYDAMTSKRSYRKGLTKEEAITEIKNNAGTQFDPALCRIFVEQVLHAAWDEC